MENHEIEEAARAITALSQATFESEEEILNQLKGNVVSEEDAGRILEEINLS